MRALRIGTTLGLLLFVGVTVGVLIAQEVLQPAHESGGAVTGPANLNEDPPLATHSTETLAVEDDDGGPIRLEEKEGVDQIAASNTEAERDADGEGLDPPAEISSEAVSCRVTAIYFHSTVRCKTCRDIENLAQAVVEGDLADAVLAGRLAWRAINMQREREYIAQFALDRPTLILTRTVGDVRVEWMAMHDTWSLLRSPGRFAEYVREHVEAYLERCG